MDQVEVLGFMVQGADVHERETERNDGVEPGSYLRLIDLCITQL